MDPVQRAIDHPELPEAGGPGREREPSRAGTHNQGVKHTRARFAFIPCMTPNIAGNRSPVTVSNSLILVNRRLMNADFDHPPPLSS